MDREIRRSGFLNPPKRLALQLELLQRVVEGMQKHKGDPDYPTALDTLGVPAAHDATVLVLTNAKDARVQVRKTAGLAAAQQTQMLVFLNNIHAKLIGAYGKDSPVLFDYGFRVPEKRKVRTVRTGKKHAGATPATKTASTTEPSPSSTTTPPSATPKG